MRGASRAVPWPCQGVEGGPVAVSRRLGSVVRGLTGLVDRGHSWLVKASRVCCPGR
jgi:hypothetical protein